MTACPIFGVMKTRSEWRRSEQENFRCRITGCHTALALFDQPGKSSGRLGDTLRGSFEACFEVVGAQHDDHQVEREMTCQDGRQKLGAIEDSAFEVLRRKIDFKIV